MARKSTLPRDDDGRSAVFPGGDLPVIRPQPAPPAILYHIGLPRLDAAHYGLDRVVTPRRGPVFENPPPPGPQPSGWDRFGANPIVRTAHERIFEPLLNRSRGNRQDDAIGYRSPLAELANPALEWEERRYQAMLGRNRNTPGYGAARAAADAMQMRGPASGFQDQVLGPLKPALAGMVSGILGGSWDDMNAGADAQQAAQDRYADEHPGRSFAAGLLGGFLKGPPAAGGTPAGLAQKIGSDALKEFLTRPRPQEEDAVSRMLRAGPTGRR
jgi:hypothetical protein